VDKDCRQSIVDAIRSSGAEAIQRARHARRQRALKEEEQQARLDGEKARLDEDRTPLKPQHWIENEHYAGDLASRLYPELKRVFVEVFERRVFEILMRGAIGYPEVRPVPPHLQGRPARFLQAPHGAQRAHRADEHERERGQGA
jgi:hypothetical protein